MIIILSEQNDMSTSHVIDWLVYFDQPFLRINEIQNLKILYLNSKTNDFVFEYEEKVVSNKEITGYWYRRGYIKTESTDFSMDKLSNELINRFLNTEKSVAIKFLLSLLEHYVQNRISGFFAPNVNKLFQLQIAKKVGLCIPDSYILSENHLEYGNFITKSLDNVFDFVKDKYSIINYTNKINDSDLEKIKTQSFVQKCIDKKFEVRVFYLHGITYSMGIFSQRNEKTEIDFRHYDEDFPNRNPPIKLPKKLDKKIKNFMTTLNLECGSLDFIYNVAGEFVFLEVNPIGQFGMTSSPCNYYLERIIAKHLLGEKSI